MIEWHYLNRHDAAEDMENALPRMKKQAVSQHGKGHGDCSEGSFFSRSLSWILPHLTFGFKNLVKMKEGKFLLWKVLFWGRLQEGVDTCEWTIDCKFKHCCIAKPGWDRFNFEVQYRHRCPTRRGRTAAFKRYLWKVTNMLFMLFINKYLMLMDVYSWYSESREIS